MCRGEDRRSASSGSGSSSGSQYALCALGVGLIALGVVMIVWSMVPAEAPGNSSSSGGDTGSEGNELEPDTRKKTSSVAFVLVGAGLAMLLLAICLSIRNKHRHSQSGALRTSSVHREPGEPGET